MEKRKKKNTSFFFFFFGCRVFLIFHKFLFQMCWGKGCSSGREEEEELGVFLGKISRVWDEQQQYSTHSHLRAAANKRIIWREPSSSRFSFLTMGNDFCRKEYVYKSY
jgi:hypothetical protein